MLDKSSDSSLKWKTVAMALIMFLAGVIFISVPGLREIGDLTTEAIDNLLIAVGCTLIATVVVSLIQQYILASSQLIGTGRTIRAAVGEQPGSSRSRRLFERASGPRSVPAQRASGIPVVRADGA